jgi:WD40 repeat protein
LTNDQNNLFATGESAKNPAERSKVRIYDAGNVTSMDKLQPLVSYEEHEDIITSLAYYQNAEGVFFSGSRDCSIRMWDKREKSSVGIKCVNKEIFIGFSAVWYASACCQ